MPESGSERLLFALGIVAIGVLIAAVALEARRHDSSTALSSPAATVATTAERTATAVTTTHVATLPTVSTAAATTTTTTTPRASAPVPAGLKLRLTATADTWLSVRRSSTTGAVLFEGVLLAGETRVFSAPVFAVRFGAAANVRATLDGRALALPGGTYSVTIHKSGLGARSA